MNYTLDPKTEVERAIINAQNALDQRKFQEFSEYFLEDGKLYRPTSDKPLDGRDAIFESYQATPENRCNRHIISNVSVTLLNNEKATAIAYATVYTADYKDEEKPVFGYQITRFLIGEYHDSWVKRDGRWYLANRRALFSMNATQAG